MGVLTLIAQGDAETRRELHDRFSRHPDFELLPDCSTGEQALATIICEKPKLLITDVRLPDVSGFELLGSFAGNVNPDVILTSDDPRHAARAFDVGALDFLSRPLVRSRLQLALDRAHTRLANGIQPEIAGALGSLLEAAEKTRQRHDPLVVKARGGGYALVKTAKIDWVDAARSYVRINTDGEVIVARETLQALTERLDPTRFVRIHRSTLVNLDRVVEVLTRDHGDYSLVLESGQRLNIGRSYRRPLLELLGRPLELLPADVAAHA